MKYEYSQYDDDNYSDDCFCKEDKRENSQSCKDDVLSNDVPSRGENHKPPTTVERNCCCKKSMIEALKLLCDTELADIIDFEKFAFLSDTFIVGAKLVLLKIGSEEKDNLSNLEGNFKRFAPCNCDLIEIEGTAYYNVALPISITDLTEQVIQLIRNITDIVAEQDGILGTAVEVLNELTKIFSPGDFGEKILQAILDFLIDYFTTLPVVNKASLCNIDSIAFQVKYSDLNGALDDTRDEATEKNYQRAKNILTEKLDRTCNDCDDNSSCCKKDCDDCCCKDSILNELFNSNLSHKATLTAGNLSLREVTILGVKGDVLVIANDKKRRFYFVCAESVQFLE